MKVCYLLLALYPAVLCLTYQESLLNSNLRPILDMNCVDRSCFFPLCNPVITAVNITAEGHSPYFCNYNDSTKFMARYYLLQHGEMMRLKSCSTLGECLNEMCTWVDRRQGRSVLMGMLEPCKP